MDDNWEIVFNTSEQYLAEMAQQMLRDNGIEAVVLDKKDSVYPTIGHVEVMVEKENLASAKKLIKKFQS